MKAADSRCGHKCCWCRAMPYQRHGANCAEQRRLYMARDRRWASIRVGKPSTIHG